MSDKGKQLIPHLITSKKERDKFTQEENPDEYFFQHLIQGQSIYLLAYIGKNGTNVLSSQENLMQQARGGSIILAKASSFHQSSIATQYISMLNDLNFTGPIMIELRLDKISGQCFMIEANPRLWGPMQFTVDNNVDIFGSMLREFNYNIPINSNKITEPSHYFWSGGISPDSEPIVFHNYSSEMFIKDFSILRKQDIYLKKDTIELYINEL
jgi:predicted ATP-grasp superfamily ATP-dependent carboligase